MFGTLRKHRTWLWVFLIAVMSISMVVFFSSDVTFSKKSTAGDYGSINGEPIKQSEYFDAQNEVRLAEFLQTGKWPENDEASVRRVESQTISRVFLVGKLEEMNIRASDKAVALMVHEQLREYPYATFEKEILEPNKLKITDYERLVRNDAAIRQLISTVSISARLVTPADAEGLWKKEHQEQLGQLAVFWTSNFLDKVTITNNAIGSFYTNRMGLYRLPERLTVSYVEFPASNYLADADARLTKLTNLNEIVSEYYSRSKGATNAWTDTNGVPLPEAAAKEKIREEIRTNEGLLAARRAAAEFGNELITQADPNKAANLERLAAAKGFPVKTTKPFDRVTGLDEFEHEEDKDRRAQEPAHDSFRDVFRDKAFNLTEERPVLFSPIPGKHGVYVIARKATIPSEQQPLEKIQDKVTADYKNYMALLMARTAGQTFHTNLTNGLAQKKSFTEIAAAEKVPTIDLPPFSASTRSLTNLDSRVSLRQLQGLASELKPGQASPFLSAQPPSEGGYLFHLKARPPVDLAKMNAELPEFVGQIRVYRQNEAFQQWFRKQAELAKLSGPKRETTIGAAN
jgi:hypothetical protein